MLIYTKSGSPMLVGTDIAADAAQTMITAGDAVQVTRLKLLQDIRSASADGDNYSIDASGSAIYPKVIAVPGDIDEQAAKGLLDHARKPHTVPIVEVLDKFPA